jgi:hypothetical protein
MTGMRDDFENAIAKLDAPEEEALENEVAEEQESPIHAEAEQAETQTADETQSPEATGEEPEPPGKEQPAATDQPDDLAAAPVSWTPAAREAWKDLPEPVKQLVHKREREIQTALEDGKEYRKMGEGLNHTLNNYADVMQAEGVADPIQGIEHMLTVMRTMHRGSAQLKAQILAGFVNTYNVDVRALDEVLSNTPAAYRQPEPELPPQLQSKLSQYDQMMAYLQQQQAAEQQQSYQAATSEVAQFGTQKEFFNDVREQMADLIEFYAQRGEDLSLADAYDRACAMNPEISQVIRQRELQKNIAGKRRAASSISGRPASAGGNPAPDTIRDALLNAFEGE